MTASRPWNHIGYGGIVARTSEASSSATAARSARSTASMYRRNTARSCSVGSADGAQSRRRSGRCSRNVARARCTALFTDATLPSSRSAVCLAGQPSTSRKISTARCRGGRCWIAARNASSIVSLATTTTSGCSSLGATGSASRSGNGCSHATSVRGGRGVLGSDGAATWCGRTRRARPSRASRHAFVAIRYSQARNVERPSKPGRFFQARRNVSCTRSSDSSNEPSIR